MSEKILLPALGQFVPILGNQNIEELCVSLQLNYTPTGGTFLATFLKDSIPTLVENTLLSLPFGRVAIVKGTGTSYSSGGLLTTVSGDIVPLQASLVNFAGVEPGAALNLSTLASILVGGVNWRTMDIPIKNFSYRGQALAGVQQLATSFMLAEVYVRKSGIWVVDPGTIVGDGNKTFGIPSSDLVSSSQVLDYSLDVASVLNPVLNAAQLHDEGDFKYDSEHAQKQPKFTVQAGAPGSQGSSDFIPIPDGWLVDGNYEEWTPPSTTDFTNPSPTPQDGRYWKVFQSPTDSGKLRGITNFTRIIKVLSMPGNVSTFVGSPVTGITKRDTSKEFAFNSDGTEEGIYGFNVEKLDNVFDVISHQFYDLQNALCLTPGGGVDSGEAGSNFYSITMEMWFFPRVNPTVFGVGDPLNPFGLPNNVVIVNPNSNIPNRGSDITTYWQKFLSNYKLINSPRLKTNVVALFRGTIPQPGDGLFVSSLKSPDCGVVKSVSLNFGRSGITMNITAEKYQAAGGLWLGGGGGAVF